MLGFLTLKKIIISENNGRKSLCPWEQSAPGMFSSGSLMGADSKPRNLPEEQRYLMWGWNFFFSKGKEFLLTGILSACEKQKQMLLLPQDNEVGDEDLRSSSWGGSSQREDLDLRLGFLSSSFFLLVWNFCKDPLSLPRAEKIQKTTEMCHQLMLLKAKFLLWVPFFFSHAQTTSTNFIPKWTLIHSYVMLGLPNYRN